MTPYEIREERLLRRAVDGGELTVGAGIAFFLREIAAQLAAIHELMLVTYRGKK